MSESSTAVHRSEHLHMSQDDLLGDAYTFGQHLYRKLAAQASDLCALSGVLAASYLRPPEGWLSDHFAAFAKGWDAARHVLTPVEEETFCPLEEL